MPAYGAQFNAQLEDLRARVRELQSRVAKSTESTPAAAAALTRDPAAPAGKPADGGFSQDTSFPQEVLTAPPSEAVRDCCGTLVLDLQAELNSLLKQEPAFAEAHRNLNLLFVGLNMLSDLHGRAAHFWP